MNIDEQETQTMPKGIPTFAGNQRKITVWLRPADYDALVQLAEDQYRTPTLQAAYLIAKILGDAGRVNGSSGRPARDNPPAPIAHAERILNRARARAGGDESE